ncbi:sulfotransferase 1B1-like [Glandiceps talaboti]
MALQLPFDKIGEFEVYPDDIYLLSFSKSGTTWMKEIISLIQNGGNRDELRDISVDTSIVQLEFLYTDERTRTRLQSLGLVPNINVHEMTSPRLFSSHLRHDLLPKQLHEKKPKVIYIARNAKDVAVSCYHHQRSLAKAYGKAFKTYECFSELLTDFIDAKIPAIVYDNSYWHDHVLSWWTRRNDENILFLKYEDLIQNVNDGIKSIAKFLGKTLDEETVKTIANHVSFDNMKTNPRTLRSFYCTQALKLDPTKESPFVRRGKVGGWKDYFSVDDNATFDTHYKRWLKDSDLEMNFEL